MLGLFSSMEFRAVRQGTNFVAQRVLILTTLLSNLYSHPHQFISWHTS